MVRDLGLRYVGIDLRPEQVEANRQQWADIIAKMVPEDALNRQQVRGMGIIEIIKRAYARRFVTAARRLAIATEFTMTANYRVYAECAKQPRIPRIGHIVHLDPKLFERRSQSFRARRPVRFTGTGPRHIKPADDTHALRQAQ